MDKLAIGSTVISILAALLGLIGSAVIGRLMKKRSKLLIATGDDGKEDIIVVDSPVSDDEVVNAVRAARSLENQVWRSLQKISENDGKLTVRPARVVDFIVVTNDRKIAVEVKLSCEHLTSDNIKKYLASENDLVHVLIVSQKKASERIRKALNEYVQAGTVSFIELPPVADPVPTLEAALAHCSGLGD